MKQQSLSDIEYANRRRKTKRERFLEAMNEIIPWTQWIELIKPYYYNNKRGRRPKDIETMLRMYLIIISVFQTRSHHVYVMIKGALLVQWTSV